jgi:hypothetical protein
MTDLLANPATEQTKGGSDQTQSQKVSTDNDGGNNQLTVNARSTANAEGGKSPEDQGWESAVEQGSDDGLTQEQREHNSRVEKYMEQHPGHRPRGMPLFPAKRSGVKGGKGPRGSGPSVKVYSLGVGDAASEFPPSGGVPSRQK